MALPTPITDRLLAQIRGNLDSGWQLHQMTELARAFERSAQLLKPKAKPSRKRCDCGKPAVHAGKCNDCFYT